MNAELEIMPYEKTDAPEVRALFIAVNRLMSPPDLHEAFEAYVEHALAQEIDRIEAYYAEHDGGFWVTRSGRKLVGTFGLERVSPVVMELRRMYVAPNARRAGIGRRMLHYAEDECRRRGIGKLELSTAEIQIEALALYRSAGYHLVGEERADRSSNKTVGAGIRRYYFEKILC